MASFDIVVPCYNYGRFLERCVNSVLTQEGVDIRVLIIDDCSADDSAEIGQKLASADPRVEFRRHEQNQGHIATYNEGLLGWAKADYSLLLSADDALAPGALARAARVLDVHPEVTLLYGMARIIDNDNDLSAVPSSSSPTYQILNGARLIEFSCLVGNPVATPTAIVRTDLQQKTGGYRQQFPHTADFEMWMRMASLGPIAVLKDTQGFYRYHNSNMSTQFTDRWLNDMRMRGITCEYAYSTWNGEQIAGYAEWISEMKRNFAKVALYKSSLALDKNDLEEYAQYIAFAEEYDPALKRTPSWWRVRAKRSFGMNPLWRGLHYLKKQLRKHVVRKLRQDRVWRYESREYGWWPEAK